MATVILSNSNWNLYRNFLVVYETKNLHRAAEILGLTRSTVGSNIKELGNQIGVTLFTSSRKGVEPTSEAITLYPSIKKAIDLITEGEENVQEFTPETRAIIRLSVPSTFASYYLKDFFKAFCAKYPRVCFEFCGRANGFELLAQNNIDLIIDIDSFFKKNMLKIVPLCTLNGAYIASRDFLAAHKLTSKITKEELMQLPVASHTLFAPDMELFATTASTEVAVAMAKNDLAVAFCYSDVVNKIGDPNIVNLEISGLEMPKLNFAVGYEKVLTKAARVFIQELVAFCTKHHQR